MDSNPLQSHTHLFRKQTLNHLVKLARVESHCSQFQIYNLNIKLAIHQKQNEIKSNQINK